MSPMTGRAGSSRAIRVDTPYSRIRPSVRIKRTVTFHFHLRSMALSTTGSDHLFTGDVVGQCRHPVLYQHQGLRMYRALTLFEFRLVATTTILGGYDGGYDAALMLHRIVIHRVRKMTVEAVDVGLGMGAVLPLMGQSGR